MERAEAWTRSIVRIVPETGAQFANAVEIGNAATLEALAPGVLWELGRRLSAEQPALLEVLEDKSVSKFAFQNLVGKLSSILSEPGKVNERIAALQGSISRLEHQLWARAEEPAPYAVQAASLALMCDEAETASESLRARRKQGVLSKAERRQLSRKEGAQRLLVASLSGNTEWLTRYRKHLKTFRAHLPPDLDPLELAAESLKLRLETGKAARPWLDTVLILHPHAGSRRDPTSSLDAYEHCRELFGEDPEMTEFLERLPSHYHYKKFQRAIAGYGRSQTVGYLEYLVKLLSTSRHATRWAKARLIEALPTVSNPPVQGEAQEVLRAALPLQELIAELGLEDLEAAKLIEAKIRPLVDAELEQYIGKEARSKDLLLNSPFFLPLLRGAARSGRPEYCDLFARAIHKATRIQLRQAIPSREVSALLKGLRANPSKAVKPLLDALEQAAVSKLERKGRGIEWGEGVKKG